MITRLWPLTLLVTQLALGFDHSIELKRCKTETACFIRESCLKPSTPARNPVNLVHYTSTEMDKQLETDNSCDVVLQMKALSPNKFHVMMRVEAKDGAKLQPGDGVKLEQGVMQLHCKPGGPTGTLEIKDVGSNQDFKDDRIFCSFIVKVPAGTAIRALNNGITQKPMLIFKRIGDVDETLTFPFVRDAMFDKIQPMRCDTDLTSSSNINEPEFLQSEINTFYPPFTCSNKKLMLKPEGQPQEEALEVFCDDIADQWKKKVAGDNNGAPITGKFNVYCSEKVCRKCDPNPAPGPLDPASCPDCKPDPDGPKFAAAVGDDGCPTLKCPDNKWTVTGKSIIEGEAKCAKSVADPTKYAWFLGETELTKAGCMDEIDCSRRYAEGYPAIHPALDKGPCETDHAGKSCPFAEKPGTNVYSCKQGFKMRLMDGEHDGASDKIVEKIVCDKSTGHFMAPGHNAKYNLTSFGALTIQCFSEKTDEKVSAAGAIPKETIIVIAGVVGGLALTIGILAFIYFFACKKKKKKESDEDGKQASTRTKSKKSSKSTTKTGTQSQTASATPGEPGVDTSDGKKSGSKKDKKKEEKKFKLEEYEMWDNEQFLKKILPNFKNCDPEAKTKWVRNCLCRFYAYCNPKKVLVGSTMLSLLDSRTTPESGTINQFWLFVKQCSDDKCEDAGVWRELWRTAFTLIFSVIEKTTASDEFRLLAIKPFEAYMVEYLKKCDVFKRKDEPRSETEMRVICIEILIHTRHPDITEVLRKLTFNEKLEVPLRMLTSACYTRERDEKPGSVQLQYIRVVDTSVIDPHISEGWGTYLQHCLFGLAGFLITVKEQYQYFLFDAIYQFPMQKDAEKDRKFSPSDWLYAYKGALLHENSAKIAMEMFKKCNEGSLLHIDTLLKQKHKAEEDKEEREKTREQYRKDMKEFTQLLADLLVGEEDFNDFKRHLRFVLLFVGEMAKKGEPLDEDRIRERAINISNMVRDPGFAKEASDCLKAIGAKTSA